MSIKKSYPLRISPAVIEAMQRWADDDLRSLNAQIEYVLREALRQRGRDVLRRIQMVHQMPDSALNPRQTVGNPELAQRRTGCPQQNGAGRAAGKDKSARE